MEPPEKVRRRLAALQTHLGGAGSGSPAKHHMAAVRMGMGSDEDLWAQDYEKLPHEFNSTWSWASYRL